MRRVPASRRLVRNVVGAVLVLAMACSVGNATAIPERLRGQLLREMDRYGHHSATDKNTRLSLLGTIRSGAGCYRIVYDTWAKPNGDHPSSHLVVFDCRSGYLGRYEIPGFRPRIAGRSILFPFKPKSGNAIRFSSAGPPPLAFVGNGFREFQSPSAWPLEDTKRALISGGFTGNATVIDGWYGDALWLGDVRAGHNCYRAMLFQQYRAPDAFDAVADRRVLIFSCGRHYLGSYDIKGAFPENVSGQTILLKCDWADLPCRSAIVGRIVLSESGPPSGIQLPWQYTALLK